MNSPEVVVNFAQNKFDSNGRLIDEDTRKFLKRLLENLVIWTKRLRKQARCIVLSNAQNAYTQFANSMSCKMQIACLVIKLRMS
jgi:hypothetical protein